jgi:hypothetical protein
MAYTKLFSTIVTSSIWVEDDATRIVWITLLALSNKDGEIMAAIPGLARMAGVSVEACEKAIQTFLSPDPYSRTKDEGGRRLEVIDGGWALINHAKYRRMASDEERKEQSAIRQKRFRDRVTNNNAPVTHPSRQHNAESEIVTRESRQNSHTDTEANTDSDADTKTNTEAGVPPVTAAAVPPPAPPQKVKREVLHANDEEWLKSIEADPTYEGIDIRRELGKMQQWCNLNHKLSTRKRFLNWIGRIDKPMAGSVVTQLPLSPEQREIATWFGRQPDDWTPAERLTWDGLPMLTTEDMDALRWFYTKSGYAYLRKSLPSLLAGMRDQIDRAKNYTPDAK